MSARVYFMKRIKDCKDVSIMSPQDEQGRRTSLLCLYIVININKQIVNIADETFTDYKNAQVLILFFQFLGGFPLNLFDIELT